MVNQLINRYSANASANGYEFEYAAALMIYLEHIKTVKFFGVEKKEDIYLELINGNKIYAQAKSSLESDAIASTHFDEIFESLRTLSENNEDASKLISVFNFFRPFGSNDSYLHEATHEIKKFNELTTITKEKLKKKVSEKYNIDFNKLEFWFLRFEGEDKLNSLKTYLRNKLFNIEDININSLIECWMCLIMENASSKTNLISSEIMAGILFAKIIEKNKFDTIIDYIGLSDELSIDDEETLKMKYDDFIEVSAYHFMIYNKIRTSYYGFCNKNRQLKKKEAMKEFIKIYSKENEILKIVSPLFDEFEPSRKSELINIMSQILVGYSCAKADVINKVREVFGYDN